MSERVKRAKDKKKKDQTGMYMVCEKIKEKKEYKKSWCDCSKAKEDEQREG